ncbi:PhzF family phenazine biosynthesis protein [Paenibacillus koleovorans]|uniref:PhzF family phenazine biosynthesis protein n=1 Tax=Paenibacillus koleovorans TaxID=121608 RepID=UPI000FDB5BC9|nr:PhzF family phenazine biosynthesis protein [Paenibacillus koleovorans]
MSRKVTVHHYDAFSRTPNKGNPAGLVLDGEAFTEAEMLDIAAQVGFNETSFLVRSEVADWRIRYFTPGHEMNLCGHATMATIYALKTRGLIGDREELTIETKAGVLPIRLEQGAGEDDWWITMKQAPPQFVPFGGSPAELAGAIGLEEADLDKALPIVYGSTGIWTLLVPVRTLEAFRRMKPGNARFPGLLTEMPRASLHPFCLETYDPSAQMHARHFSSPYSGTVEDPVTGTASGVMGAYYATYLGAVTGADEGGLQLLIEQGQEIGRDGRVQALVARDAEGRMDVRIRGQAVYVGDLEISLKTGQDKVD